MAMALVHGPTPLVCPGITPIIIIIKRMSLMLVGVLARIAKAAAG